MERYTYAGNKGEERLKGVILSMMSVKNIVVELENSEQRQVPTSLVQFENAQASKHMILPGTQVLCRLQNDKLIDAHILLSGTAVEMAGVIKSSNKISTKISCKEQVLEVDTRFIFNHTAFSSANMVGKPLKIIMLDKIAFKVSIEDSDDSISPGQEYDIENNNIVQIRKCLPEKNDSAEKSHTEEKKDFHKESGPFPKNEVKSDSSSEENEDSEVIDYKKESPINIDKSSILPELHAIRKTEENPQVDIISNALPNIEQAPPLPTMQGNPNTIPNQLPIINQGLPPPPIMQGNSNTIPNQLPTTNQGLPPPPIMQGNPNTIPSLLPTVNQGLPPPPAFQNHPGAVPIIPNKNSGLPPILPPQMNAVIPGNPLANNLPNIKQNIGGEISGAHNLPVMLAGQNEEFKEDIDMNALENIDESQRFREYKEASDVGRNSNLPRCLAEVPETDSLYIPLVNPEEENNRESYVSKFMQGVKRLFNGYMYDNAEIYDIKLRIPLKEKYKNVPEHLTTCYIDGIMAKESNQSLRLLFYVTESILRFRSLELCDKLYIYLVNLDIEPDEFLNEFKALINSPILPFEELRLLVQKYSGIFARTLKVDQEATYQALSDILGVKIDFYHTKEFKLRSSIPKVPENDLLIIHLLFEDKKLYGVYFPEHLTADGIDIASNSVNYVPSIIPKRYPLYYLSDEFSTYTSSISNLFSELIHANPSVAWQLKELSKMTSSRRLNNQISDILSSKFCSKCEREATVIEICRNQCRVCYKCMLDSVSYLVCLCKKLIDFEFISESRHKLKMPCMLCGKATQGHQASMFMCGCYICQEESAPCLYQYKETQQAQCPYCFEALSEVSFNFNDFLIAD